MSVDLAGSTAYKNGVGKDPVTGDDSHPRWVQRIRHFYREFPHLVQEHYGKLCHAAGDKGVSELAPRVWKTIGDEIIMCCRLRHLEHLATCVQAFLRALKDYGKLLDSDGGHLDLKGAGWVAAFPIPNVTVALDETRISADQFDEDFELGADLKPASVDFLGNGIDCGFRISTRSSTNRFVVSIELAWLLADASHRRWFDGVFRYHDRAILRGVIKDRPYPIISIDTERSPGRREVLEAERALTGGGNIAPTQLRNFAHAFMLDEGIEVPVLGTRETPEPRKFPDSYERFAIAWRNTVESLTAQTAEQQEAEQSDGAGEDTMPTDVENAIDALLSRFKTSSFADTTLTYHLKRRKRKPDTSN